MRMMVWLCTGRIGQTPHLSKGTDDKQINVADSWKFKSVATKRNHSPLPSYRCSGSWCGWLEPISLVLPTDCRVLGGVSDFGLPLLGRSRTLPVCCLRATSREIVILAQFKCRATSIWWTPARSMPMASLRSFSASLGIFSSLRVYSFVTWQYVYLYMLYNTV